MSITRRTFLTASSSLGLMTMLGCGDDSSSGDAAAAPAQGAAGQGGTGQGGAAQGGQGGAQTGEGGEGGAGGSGGPKEVPAPLPSDDKSKALFKHGVASGDPLAQQVIIWTRVTAEDPSATVEVEWQVASEPTMNDIVAKGTVMTSADRDFTVKVDAMGLSAGTTYYYRFVADGGSSPIGRTRTLPEGKLDRLRLGVVSCSNYNFGYFHGYRELAKKLDLDAILHLGDYIYEYGPGEYGGARVPDPPHEIISLEDYRLRYAQYRADADLQAVHQQHPFIVVWDDHEIADNGWKEGAKNHNPDKGEGDFAARRAAATQAYFEWLPIRDNADNKVYRSFEFGDLVTLAMLDTRYWGRAEQVDVKDETKLNDPARQFLGEDQEAWLFDLLKNSKAQFRIIGQQVVLSQIDPLFQDDAWAGYPPARKRVLDEIKNNGYDNVVVLTGDIHSSWVNDITLDAKDKSAYDAATGMGSLGVEFVSPAISSPGAGKAAATAEAIAKGFPNVKWVNFLLRGFIIVDVDDQRVQAAYHHYDTPEEEKVDIVPGPVWAMYKGQTFAKEEDKAAGPKDAPDAAPPV